GDSGSGEVTMQKVLDFNDLAAGTVVSDQYSGVSIYSCDQNSHPTMIFDSANPTGGDSDLATSNLGGVLILSEDGDSADPDDDASGGVMVFDFDDPVDVDQLTFLDLDEKYAKVYFYDENGDQIGDYVKTYGQGDNSQIVQDYDVDGVSRMEVKLYGSGAIDNLTYSTTVSAAEAGYGDDVVDAGDGDDLVFGEGGSDTIDGGAGDDTIFGGNGDGSSETTRESFNWSDLEDKYGGSLKDGEDVPSGQTQNTGSVDVTFTIANSKGVDTEFEKDSQNIDDIDGGSETINHKSSLESETSKDNETATYRLDFSENVANVDFRVNDIDHDSVVNVVAYDAAGNQIPVTLTASATTDLDLSDTDSVAGIDTASATNNSGPNTGDDNSILVEVAGPVASIEITHSNDGGDGSNVNITDVLFDAGGDIIAGPGNDEGDSILGGTGDDLIYGQEGSDTIDGEEGNDTIYGGGPEGTTSSEREIFEWSEGPGFGNNADAPNFTQDTGSANITFTTVNTSGYAATDYQTTDQDTSELDAEVGENSSLSSNLYTSSDSATYQWQSDTPVEDVEFRINDIDGDGRVVVRAYDENGNPVEVTLSDAGSGLALSDSDGVPGNDTATSTDNNYTNDDNPEHSVLVNIEGPVSRWEIVHEQDGRYDSGINVTDIAFDVPVVTGGTGDDTGDSLTGGEGDDVIFGQGGDDTIFGNDGSDTIEGGTGDDYIDASSDDPVDLPDLGFPSYMGLPEVPADLDPNNDKDFVDGGAGNDTILTGDDDDTIIGGSGDDLIDGGVDKDLIEAGSGDDTIIGGEGNDTIDGGDGDDLIFGGLDPAFPDYLNIPNDGSVGDPDPELENGRDLIDGGAGDDTIYGQDDDDTITGGSGDDYLDGGVDDDLISGGDGSDTIIGGQGTDTMSGGDGNDTFIVSDGTHGDGDVITGGAGPDDTTDWDVLDLTGSGPRTVNATADAGDSGALAGTVTFDNGDVLTFSGIEEIICFTPGTAILTPSGEVAVENLKVGDKVVTRDNGLQTIRWAGKKQLSGRDLLSRPKLRPVMIRAGSLGPNLPERDMMVSPNHRMLLVSEQAQLLFDETEVLVAAKHLVGMDGVQQVDTVGVEYVHFLCDNHEVVLANGAWSESFQPGEYSMGSIDRAQRDEIYDLFPELRNREALDDFTAARLTLKRHEANLLVK
ncbi:MAG: Hint domain-containing protein, partial [Rhodobacteraceae bacterium]|nr:Hint domain-containing protein [Paracoccaceae bacterium]